MYLHWVHSGTKKEKHFEETRRKNTSAAATGHKTNLCMSEGYGWHMQIQKNLEGYNGVCNLWRVTFKIVMEMF